MKGPKLISTLSYVLHELGPAASFASMLPVASHNQSYICAFGHLAQAHVHTLIERLCELVFLSHLPVSLHVLFLLLRQAFYFLPHPSWQAFLVSNGFPKV